MSRATLAGIVAAFVAALTPSAAHGQATSTLSGYPVVGQTLTQTSVPYDFGVPDHTTKEWLRCKVTGGCTAIPGATGDQYLVTDADLDHRLQFFERAYNSSNEPIGYRASVPTAVVDLAASRSDYHQTTLSGRRQTGQVLTIARTHEWLPTPASYAYAWYRCTDGQFTSCVAIDGATAQTYTLAAADVGKFIVGEERARNAAGDTSRPSRSAPLGLIQQERVHVAGTAPTISGGNRQGDTLTVTSAQWDPPAETTEIKWMLCDAAGERCGPPTAGSGRTREIAPNHAGYTFRVQEAAQSVGGGWMEPVLSAATPLPVAPRAPIGPGYPDLMIGPGIYFEVGTTATILRHAGWDIPEKDPWTGAAFPVSYQHQWLRCPSTATNYDKGSCVPIPGATGETYTATTADIGSYIGLDEYGINAGGRSPTAARTVATGIKDRPGDLTGTGLVRAPGAKPPVGPPTGPPPLDAARLNALLKQYGEPKGPTATVKQVLAAGGYTAMGDIYGAEGSVSVSWYRVPSGAKVSAKRKKKKPVLVATGSTKLTQGPDRVMVKLTKAGKKLLRKTIDPLSLTSKVTVKLTGKAPAKKVKRFVLPLR